MTSPAARRAARFFHGEAAKLNFPEATATGAAKDEKQSHQGGEDEAGRAAGGARPPPRQAVRCLLEITAAKYYPAAACLPLTAPHTVDDTITKGIGIAAAPENNAPTRCVPPPTTGVARPPHFRPHIARSS